MKFFWFPCWILFVQQMCAPFSATESANILFFHQIASYSHLVSTWPLAEALANRGHNVTYIAPYRYKQPNPKINEFVPVKMAKYLETFIGEEYDINLRVEGKQPPLYELQWDFSYDACDALYTSPDFEDWLKSNPKFDLVIVDSCFDHECGVGLAYKLSAKFAYFSTTPIVGYEYDAFGFLPESSAVPEFDVGSPSAPMGFLTRVQNTLMSIRWRFWHYFVFSQQMDKLIRSALNVTQMPFIADLVSQAALVFYTGDVISDYPRSLPPNYVNVAGLHCKEASKTLPEDITKFIESKTVTGEENDGFVYISLGSLVISSNLPEQIKKVFFDAIKAFPKVKFLWKWNGDFPKEIPDNLFLRKWYPQQDLLGHEKIRGFVTQSGRPSCVEAVFNGVPMISFPVLGDQDFNANRLAEAGVATRLELGTVTLDEMKDAIRKTVYDSTVKARMAKIKKIFRDRPMTPVETGVWWTEYALRFEDVEHLRPAGASQSWFVRRLVDVWAFLSISCFLVMIGTIMVLYKVAQKVLNVKSKKIKAA